MIEPARSIYLDYNGSRPIAAVYSAGRSRPGIAPTWIIIPS